MCTVNAYEYGVSLGIPSLAPHFGHSPQRADSGECFTSLTAVKLLFHPKSLVYSTQSTASKAFLRFQRDGGQGPAPGQEDSNKGRNCKLQGMYNHAGCFNGLVEPQHGWKTQMR